MALRTFVGSDGVEWHVWSVVPGTRHGEERRAGDRRSLDPIVIYRGPERRSGSERRSFESRVRPGMEQGWLTCQSPTERRRIVPAPPRWELMSDAELDALCARADVVPSVRSLRS